MKIFMDTANVDEIKQYVDWGVVYGVTTNPSLIAKSGRTQAEVIPEIAALVSGPVSAEVISTECAGMIEEARKLAKIAENVVIKIPCIPEGLKAVKILSAEGIKTNVTLVFSMSQALLAARAGATFVSPFIGRLDDIGQDGVQLVDNIVKSFKLYGIETEVIAASIRNIEHVEKVMLTGCQIATIPTKVLAQMINHQLTDKGLAQFMADYQNSLK
ncbi:fructose-6-phosphate aldolase [Phascolarctobacterium sp.]|uniref:fructose-6-phosphate aldolase n=1 Tax=Phascolarctobacterium sp. TaxID=2049039 RepID=UPI002A7F70E2|nr:fructose-6-phosphate aldolase [Phascolarctobacterium sp.]MDY5045966.1 fructose-6-phosphate aldolase [Phascolarctobacterium sp.]MEE1231029.1 fructose-6-phosphate aldolase [Phascolarctobacterium sp.]